MPTPKRVRRQDGYVWRVRFRLAGRGSTETTETFDTEVQALAFARDVQEVGGLAARQRREETMQRRDALTVDQAFDQFLTWKTPRVRSDRTIVDYRRDYRLWIAPTFGHRPVTGVLPDDVRGWIDGMVSGEIRRGPRPASPKSIHDRHALLHAVMAWAVKYRHAAVNPCVGTELPRRRKGQPKGLWPAEWQALHAALRQVSPDAADLAAFLVGSGWRWSEATALTTYDVEDSGQRMWVTVSHVARRTASGQVVDVVDAKAEASLRRVELDAPTARLVRRRVLQAAPGGIVFATPAGRRWHYSNFRDRAWNPAVKAANLAKKPTPHALRHTHVGLLVMAGASLAEIQARIGHADITTTIGTYGRMIGDVQPAALAKFAAMLDPAEGPATLGGHGEVTER